MPIKGCCRHAPDNSQKATPLNVQNDSRGPAEAAQLIRTARFVFEVGGAVLHTQSPCAVSLGPVRDLNAQCGTKADRRHYLPRAFRVAPSRMYADEDGQRSSGWCQRSPIGMSIKRPWSRGERS